MHIELNFPEITQGDWVIESFYENDIKYQKLIHKGIIKMINTPDIVNDFEHFLTIAEGSVLINGLGMGMCNVHLLKKNTLLDLTVIEYDESLVKFITPFFKDDSRCTIIHGDALTYESPQGKQYDFVWHDIWTLQSATNVKTIDFLKDKYKNKANWQGAWREEICRQQALDEAARRKIISEQ